jgi:hypothetical protein
MRAIDVDLAEVEVVDGPHDRAVVALANTAQRALLENLFYDVAGS